MNNIFELKKGDKTQKSWAKELKKIYVCPSDVGDYTAHRECIIWKTMDSGCDHCPFRTFDL